MTDDTSVTTGTESALRHLLHREPALPILLMASVAMVTREYVPDIALFVGASALLLVDAPRWNLRTASAEPRSREDRRWLVIDLAAGAALLLAVLPRPSAWQDGAFAVVGLAALMTVWLPGRELSAPPRTEPTEPTRWWAWPALAVALALVELFSFLHDTAPRVDDPAHPTISSLVEPALAAWPVRAVLLWLWLLGGWWLWRRIRAWAS